MGANTDTYTPALTSNQLASITPSSGPVRNYTHDANGSVTADGNVTYTYDTRGRLTQTVVGAVTTDYKVNAVRQRIRKTDSSTDTVYHYDMGGRLIAETDASGTLQKEYIYLHDMPVAVLDGSGTMAYIHTDHLNTPRVITNQVGQPVWKWDNNDPFGGNAPDENPSGLGAFIFDLRFAGQVWNNETQTAYNYFRDCYDPATGRYCQSDPIGLIADANTYAYVGSNPLRNIDPAGLADKPMFDPKSDSINNRPGSVDQSGRPGTYEQNPGQLEKYSRPPTTGDKISDWIADKIIQRIIGIPAVISKSPVAIGIWGATRSDELNKGEDEVIRNMRQLTPAPYKPISLNLNGPSSIMCNSTQ